MLPSACEGFFACRLANGGSRLLISGRYSREPDSVLRPITLWLVFVSKEDASLPLCFLFSKALLAAAEMLFAMTLEMELRLVLTPE